jgi:hypothetical protein
MNRPSIIAIIVVSLWVACTLFMWFAATRSFRTADAILANPQAEFAALAKPLSADETRMLVRHVASQINRTYFQAYGWVQVTLGLLLVILLYIRAPRDLTGVIVAAAMFGLALLLTFYITPQIVSMGRSIDFLPRHPAPAVMPRFWMFHGAFTGLDGLKLLGGIFLLVRWIIRIR